MTADHGLEYAQRQDAADPLSSYRDRFEIPKRPDGTEAIYFCGNSLGLQPKAAAAEVRAELDAWGTLAVAGHFVGTRPWVAYQARLASLTAALVGADPSEVVTMNTLTVNLHFMMVSFYQPSAARHKIVIERPAFPSDRYAVESQMRFHGFDPADALLEVGPRSGESAIRMDDLERRIAEDGPAIALVLLPGVNYYSGQVYDMERLAHVARAHGCRVGFNLAHAIGNIPLRLHDWGPDFAVWCSYKYLNGGPGAVAGCFVHRRHGDPCTVPRFTGWWGNDLASRFQMAPEFVPSPGAQGWQVSNPPILSLAPVLASLAMFGEVGLNALRVKSVRLTAYLASRVEEELGDRIDMLTPREPDQRGCQLSLRVRGTNGRGRQVFEQLEREGVVCDWREPDVIRAAPVPLYNTYKEVYRFVDILKRVLESRRWS